MAAWSGDELGSLGDAREVTVRATRADGSLRAGVPVWIVRVDDGLYLRSYKGGEGLWYRSARARSDGRLEVGGAGWDIVFVPEGAAAVNDLVDAAFDEKYASHGPSYIQAMVAPAVRATTLRVDPR
jgi:hypothetical protein